MLTGLRMMPDEVIGLLTSSHSENSMSKNEGDQGGNEV